MPLVDWNLESTWWLNYNAIISDPDDPRHEERVTYGRDWYRRFWTPRDLQDTADRWKKRMDTLRSLTSKDRILIVGCAFGFLLEQFIDDGFNRVWGTDTSDWIHSNLQEVRDDVRDRILKKDPRDSDAAQYFKGHTGKRTFAWVITEEVLSSYSDDEFTGLLNACENLVQGNRPDRVVHIVNVPGTASPAFNLKTGEDWKAVRSDHTWVALPDHKVI